MSVLLLNPPSGEMVYSSLLPVSAVYPPLGLGYLAGTLERNGIEVNILDANTYRYSISETVERILKTDAEVIGITATSTTIPVVYALAHKIKRIDSDRKVIVGGVHVSFMPDRTLRECKEIDFIVRNEGEYTLLELVNCLKNGKNEFQNIAGITYREENETIRSNPNRPFIENPDELPFPARNLLPISKYHPDIFWTKRGKKGNFTTLITTRGCPYNCVYCSAGAYSRHKVRMRSPENVVEEIRDAIDKYNITDIYFIDDIFTINPKRTITICNEILDQKLDINWACYARANLVTKEQLEKMKKAGCHLLNFGVESGNQDVLNRINKALTLDQIRKAINLAKKMDFKVYASFMIGLPGDNKSTIEQTIKFSKELNPDYVEFFLTTPFPGTKLWEDYVQEGVIDADFNDWGKLSIMHQSVVKRVGNLSSRDLKKLMKIAYVSFYLRPGFIMHSLRNTFENPREANKYLTGFASYLLYLVE